MSLRAINGRQVKILGNCLKEDDRSYKIVFSIHQSSLVFTVDSVKLHSLETSAAVKKVEPRIPEPINGRQIPKRGWTYRGSKGNKYRVFSLAWDLDEKEDVVLYSAIAGNTNEFDYWQRPLDEFLEVLGEGTTNYYRFERIGATDEVF